jgi:hypothetical protein
MKPGSASTLIHAGSLLGLIFGMKAEAVCSPKITSTSAGLHGVMSQKTQLFRTVHI